MAKQLISYLDKCLKKDMIVRWPDNCIPLSVYIAPFRWYKAQGNDSYTYKRMAMDAFKEWEKISNGKIKFKFVDALKGSHINLDWKRVDRNALGHCHFHYDNQGRFFSAEVQIGISDGLLHANYQDKNEVYHTILHEAGHALGLDHSPFKEDMMYVPHQYGIIKPTQRDINTLKWLYKFPCGTGLAEILSYYGVSSDKGLDYIVFKEETKAKKGIEKEKKGPRPDQTEKINNDQNTLADINKFNLALQNINIPTNTQDYLKRVNIDQNNPTKPNAPSSDTSARFMPPPPPTKE